MPFLLLIRHGENDYVQKGRLAGRLPGVHLNENGRRQAQALVETLAEAPISAIYCSPLERAVETAQPLADRLDLQITLRQGLLETDYGDWQGKTLKGLRRRKLWWSIQELPSQVRFPGGESFAECQERVCRELQSICSGHEAKDLVACVFHADPIKLAVAHYIGLSLDHFQRLSSAPASITALHIADGRANLVTLNYHLSLNFPKP
jgi:probable phosphoglycerate mutase